MIFFFTILANITSIFSQEEIDEKQFQCFPKSSFLNNSKIISNVSESESQISKNFPIEQNLTMQNSGNSGILSYRETKKQEFTTINNFNENKLNANPYLNPPELIVNLFGGYNLPLTQLKGDLTKLSLTDSSTLSISYYEKWGFDLGFNLKFPIDKNAKFRLILTFLYSKFYQNAYDSTGKYEVKPRLNDFQAGIGAEWAFTNFKKFIPYVNAEFTVNMLDGSIEFVDNSASFDLVTNYNPATRYGLSFGIGCEYIHSTDVGAFAGINYNMTNLIGKSYNTTGAHDLNDASFTSYNRNIAQKNISFLNFYAGISFYLGYSKISKF